MIPLTLTTLVVVVLCLSPIRVEGIYRYRYRDVLQQNHFGKIKQADNVQPAAKETTAAEDDVQELYFSQTLDHFDSNNHGTFQQRYFKTDRYIVENQVSEFTFLCVGGEGPGMDKSVLVDSVHCTGDMLELAKRLSNEKQISVHVYALEHRYYGTSYPAFGNGKQESPVTNQNLRFLSSRQALEDLAHFVHSINEEQGVNTKWVTFGGSYPGFMAAYARLKYPHLVYAGVSSSAPLDLKVDFPGYNQLVGADLKYPKVGGSEACFDVVKEGHNQAVQLIETDPIKLAETFNICTPENLKDRRNQEVLLYVLSMALRGDGLIQIPAQSNDPSCEGELCNIERLCQHMTSMASSTNSSAMDILVDVASKQAPSGACLEVDWNTTLAELSKPTVTEEGWRSWLWQTCTEVGFYQTCEDESCPYAASFHSVDMDLEICSVVFNVTNVHENVQASLDYYGGLDLDGGSRVLFVNGDVDPWSALGVLNSTRCSLPAAIVAGASHHAWTHVVRESDAPEIVQVRKYIYSVVENWLGVRSEEEFDEDKQIPRLRGCLEEPRLLPHEIANRDISYE
eukprot:scaffold791_cov115-Cylindrotheca_fusiformis.AAC.8